MKMFKKAISIALAAFMSLGVLTACSSGTSSQSSRYESALKAMKNGTFTMETSSVDEDTGETYTYTVMQSGDKIYMSSYSLDTSGNKDGLAYLCVDNELYLTEYYDSGKNSIEGMAILYSLIYPYASVDSFKEQCDLSAAATTALNNLVSVETGSEDGYFTEKVTSKDSKGNEEVTIYYYTGSSFETLAYVTDENGNDKIETKLSTSVNNDKLSLPATVIETEEELEAYISNS